MPINLYEVLWIFVIYAFVGWCTEVAYAGLNKGVFVNRGFLNGPYCPIYGFGVLIVVALLTPLKDNLLILFLGAVLLTTVLEYFTGLILEKAFGNKWWDYSHLPFNIQGYVCLKFSIFWGLGCMFIMKNVHPAIYKFIQWIPKGIGAFLLVLLVGAFAIDVCVTVNTILKFNKKIRMMEEVAERMRRLSDEIGEDIFEKVTDIAEKAEEVEDFLEEKRDDAKSRLEEARMEYKAMLTDHPLGFRRLTKAFPDMKSRKYDKVLQQYKEQLKTKKNKG